MGCPDWPTCYGLLIPPTDSTEVSWYPNTDYAQGQMVIRRDTLWVADSAFTSGKSFYANPWSPYPKHDYAIFNPVHTWIEFLNRLLGALLGIPVAVATLWTMKRFRAHPKWTITMLLALVVLGFEAWLGKVVVDGNLVPHQITYHMTGAFALLGLLTAVYRSVSSEWELHAFKAEREMGGGTGNRVLVFRLFLGLIALLSIQIIMGTQVREEVDSLVTSFGLYADRTGWVDQLPFGLWVHRSFSLLILALSFWTLRKSFGLGGLKARAALVFFTLLTETALGAAMFYLDIPRYLQPVHLFLSAVSWFLLVDGTFKAWLMLRKA